MSSREIRLSVLAVILLLALGYLLFGPDSYFRSRGAQYPQTTYKTLPGNNEIVSVTLIEVSTYKAELEIEYFYNGAVGPYALLHIEIPLSADSADTTKQIRTAVRINTGKNKIKAPVHRFLSGVPAKLQTKTAKVAILRPGGGELVSRTFEQTIYWPSSDQFSLASNELGEVERLYKLCVDTIDSERDLDNAKRGLEKILLAKPEYVPAYAELARYQMKTNWSPDGLAQAEQSLNTALRLDPNHANSHVLIGYVYTHQRRFKEAEAALRKAEKIGTGNIWLYTNWGVLRALEGKRHEAIEKYRKAIEAPPSLKTHERARSDAYVHLLEIFTADKRWSEADTLHQQRITKYPDNGCHKADYALFHLVRNGDHENAIAIGSKALEQQCPVQHIDERLILAMAYYTKWAKLLGSGADARTADQHFNRGQALYSDMPKLLYSLARSSHTATVIPSLKRRGIVVDAPDREGISALVHSIINRDMVATDNLIRHGSNVNQRLNADGLTPLMLAASRGDYDFVAMLLRKGADRNLRTRSGYTAERIAAMGGHKKIAALLTARPDV